MQQMKAVFLTERAFKNALWGLLAGILIGALWGIFDYAPRKYAAYSEEVRVKQGEEHHRFLTQSTMSIATFGNYQREGVEYGIYTGAFVGLTLALGIHTCLFWRSRQVKNIGTAIPLPRRKLAGQQDRL